MDPNAADILATTVGTRGLQFGLLGPTIVVGEAGEVAVRGVLRRRLLARLLISANRAVPIERLREDLWDGRPPSSAASTLKSHISLLRRLLGSERLRHQDGSYVICVGRTELDVFLFEEEAVAGLECLRAGRFSGAAEVLGRGLGRWRDRALCEVSEASWAQPEAVRLEEMRAAAMEGWLAARLELGESQQVVAEAEAAVAEHPLREGLWAKLITGLYRCGRQADALRAYQRLRHVLGEELGISPSPELVALESAILHQEEAIAAPRHVGVAVGGLPLRPVATNLPRDLTSFVGRPAELADVAGLLDAPGLVTLTGAGGTGKTRLATRAASELLDSFDGVWFSALAAVSDDSQVLKEVAGSVGCSDSPGVELAETVATRLAEGRNLLILDNCEHVVDVAASLASRFLGVARELRLLATSRTPLGVEGEVTYRVPSMPVPAPGAELDVEDLLGYESIALFTERALSQLPGLRFSVEDYAHVASVCERLGGIPLAIELAAARVRNLSIHDIAERLDDRFSLLTTGPRTAPARQKTLKASIDWSFDLLDDCERRALARLAVFMGGFDLPAAESVVGTTAGGRPAVDAVSSLVDQSLLHVDLTARTTRYRMLETVREYALDTLRERGEEDEARGAHARWYLEVVEAAAPHFVGPDQLLWRVRLEPDDENLHAAFTALLATTEWSLALRFGAAVSKFWTSRGVFGEEVALLEAALDGAGETVTPAVRGAALVASGYLLFRRGQTARAHERLLEALRIAGATGSTSLRADALRTMAWVALRRGQEAEALALATEALGAALSCREAHLIARAYDVRAAASQSCDPGEARSDYEEALRHCRAAGDRLGQATALNNLAILELEQGSQQHARTLFGKAWLLTEEVEDPALLPFVQYGMGLVALLDDDPGGAGRSFMDAWYGARRTGQRSLTAYALLGLALTRVTIDATPDAAVLLGAASALFEELGERPEPIEAGLYEQAESTLKSSLGDEASLLLDRGRRLSGFEVADLVSAALPMTMQASS